MAKKSGIELKLTYGTWNCPAPAKCKNLAAALKQNIKSTMLNGLFDRFSRAFPVKVDAPFMGIDTAAQTPYVKVELNEKHVKSHPTFASGLEINYDGPIKVTMYWKVSDWAY